MINTEPAVNELKKASSIAIASHIMPDGDSIGSMLSLYFGLKNLGKYVDVYSSDRCPDIYSFLPGANFIRSCQDIGNKEYDAFVVLDCGSVDRTGDCAGIKDTVKQVINIDHHATNSMFGDVNIVDTGASSTGEIVYHILKQINGNIGKDEACCLYTAILTDTGCFRYSNTTSVTHTIISDILTTGIDFGKIHSLIYNNHNFDDIKLMGKALSSMEIYLNGKAAFMQLLREDFEGYDLEKINTSEYISYARDIKGVEVAAFAKEVEDGEFKVSFRSRNIVDVRAICEKFGGGGHVRAAGCTIMGSISQVRDTVLKELEKELKGDNIWMEY
jgi:Exopolyphosphatase-related proteins